MWGFWPQRPRAGLRWPFPQHYLLLIYTQGDGCDSAAARGLPRSPETFPAAERRPLYITEFGVRGKDWQGPGKEPGVFEDGTPIVQTGIAALQVGWLMTEATRRGFVATQQWEGYDMAYGKRPMH